ncbi:MAG: energy transducer TonB [Saprospiraceae bacterium]|uniref:Energy transducer TonB n=1 Tax=Candidatus Opimibacter skivensis TaxID=2982028 RepID=A0A9D7SWK8_9BACT|nr:energy transducer TonB [Candidatus Opimibacter skivensis]
MVVLFSLFIFNCSCSGKKQLISTKVLNDPPQVSEGVNSPKASILYYIFKDGAYFEAELDKIPEIIGGLTALYHDIRYPAFAREHGIQGTVRITVIVNEFGQLEDAVINSHVGGGCDEEGLRVVKQYGFTPAEINGKPVKVKYDIPLRFILQ